MNRLLVVILMICLTGCVKTADEYGLVSSDGHYVYSYLVTGAELLVKNYADFTAQFESREFTDLVSLTDSAPGYQQAEVLYLPVVQRLVPGRKSVLVFETTEEKHDGIIVKRLALECDSIMDTLRFPQDFCGYYMVDAWEWPPDLCPIDSGTICVDRYDPLLGYLTGTIDVSVVDDTWSGGYKRITGSFYLRDKDKTVTLLVPARESQDSR